MLWIMDNISTIIISAVLLAIIVLIASSIIKNRKNGKFSCACSFGSCPMSGNCQPKA